MEDLKYLNGKGPKPNYNFYQVPFIVSDQKGKLLIQNQDAGAEYLYIFIILFYYIILYNIVVHGIIIFYLINCMYTGNESRPAESDSVYYHAAVILCRK
jgi:hypothetical protein